MKKLVLSIVAIIMTFVLVPIVKADEKVHVYMISKDGCSACAAASEYFADLATSNPDLFELYDIQVFDANWQFESDELQQLFLAVYEKFGEDTSKAATPTIVIGDYHTVGLPQDTSAVYDAIVAAKDKDDEMKKIAEELNIDLEKVRKNENTSEENEKSGKYDALIIIGIFIVLIGGFAGLVIASKK